MFSFFQTAQKRLHELQLAVTTAEQVVLSLEQTSQATGPEKKRMALNILTQLLKTAGLDPPQLLLDTVIEAAIRLTK